MEMSIRMNYRTANPQVFQAMMQMEQHVQTSGIEPKLLELIKIRASQLNGCAFCLDMHTKDARKAGETEQRIYLLNAWRESEVYTKSERAVLALTEAVTLIAQNGVSDEVFADVREYFDEQQTAALIMAINTINCWNRLAITTGMTAPARL